MKRMKRILWTVGVIMGGYGLIMAGVSLKDVESYKIFFAIAVTGLILAVWSLPKPRR